MKVKPYDDSNWTEEYQTYTSNTRYLQLLKNGAKNLSQSWILMHLYNEWKRIKGYDKFDPVENKGQCQSSFKEWGEKFKKDNLKNSNI